MYLTLANSVYDLTILQAKACNLIPNKHARPKLHVFFTCFIYVGTLKRKGAHARSYSLI